MIGRAGEATLGDPSPPTWTSFRIRRYGSAPLQIGPYPWQRLVLVGRRLSIRAARNQKLGRHPREPRDAVVACLPMAGGAQHLPIARCRAGALQSAPRAARGRTGRPRFPSGLPAPARPKLPATASETSRLVSGPVPRLPLAPPGRAQARAPPVELGSRPRPSSRMLPVQDLPPNSPLTVRASVTPLETAARCQQGPRADTRASTRIRIVLRVCRDRQVGWCLPRGGSGAVLFAAHARRG
jgi:hypothetical protein